jgi:inner membrane protein involved in colicin E2 resistance
MVKRIIALSFIFVCTAIAWFILGGTIFSRTHGVDTRLRDNVASTWGAPHSQKAPEACYYRFVERTVETTENDKKVTRTVRDRVTTSLPLEASQIAVDFDLEHRQKGLLWYSTYRVAFDGTYTYRNPSSSSQSVTFTLDFPAAQAIYDNLEVAADGEPLEIRHQKNAVVASTDVLGGESVSFKLSYRSQGLNSWRYVFGEDLTQVRDFSLIMNTNLEEIDFPENTLSPSDKQETPAGWELTWRYNNLLTGYQLGMEMPEKLQPGPLAGRISFFAPVSLFFFFFLLFIITTIRDIEIHPMNYFFLAASFFSFHLLLAYLADHVSIHLAFFICAVVSLFLVISYLRLVVGPRFAFVEAGLAQFIYLVLFSYTFFLEGYTGLSITIGSIITLFVVMQATARINWSEKFAGKKSAGTTRSS